MRAYVLAALPLFAVACASTSETNDGSENAGASTANTTTADTAWDGFTCDGEAIRAEELHRLRAAAGDGDELGRWTMRLRYQDCDRDNGCGEWHEDAANQSGAEASDLAGSAALVAEEQVVGPPLYTIGLTSDTTCRIPGTGNPTYRYGSWISTAWDITQIGRITVPRARSGFSMSCSNAELPLWQQGAENKVTDHCFRVRTWGQHNTVDGQSWRAFEAVVSARW